MMLKDKVAVIYGAGGAIGGAVARAFASEGGERLRHRARSGRRSTRSPRTSSSAGGSAEAAEVDALDEQAVDEHLQSVVERAGRVDISFNAVGIPDAEILGVPLIELDADAVLAADRGLHEVVLPDRPPGRTAHDPEPIGGDHDRHRAALADGHPVERRLRPGAGRQGGAHARPVRRARASRHSRGRSATARHAGDEHDEGGLRRQGHGDDLGAVPGVPREHDAPATGHDARRRWRTWRSSWRPTGRAG